MQSIYLSIYLKLDGNVDTLPQTADPRVDRLIYGECIELPQQLEPRCDAGSYHGNGSPECPTLAEIQEPRRCSPDVQQL